MVFLLAKYYSGNQIGEDEMGGSCGTNRTEIHVGF
jgi:hypothetical protein